MNNIKTRLLASALVVGLVTLAAQTGSAQTSSSENSSSKNRSSETLPSTAIPPAGVSRQHTVDKNTTAKTPSSLRPGTSKEGFAHNTGDVANGPTPPRQAGAQPTAPRNAPPTSATIVPGPASSHGDTEVGNSSEHNGLIGSGGAGASATMGNGYNR